MDIRKWFLDYLLVIFLVNIPHGFCSFEDDYEDGTLGRCPRIRSKLKNGRVRLRYKGRVAKFMCDSGYELAGKRSSTCVRGQWSNPIPVCVARGCNRVPTIANGRVTEMYRGALLVYDCNPGYTLTGDISIHCDGRLWNASPPICRVNPDVRPVTTCDFESTSLCGWTHDPTHDFDWKRHQLATPSGHVGTGPSYDHTFGENNAGYYMYIEASSPRKINDTARLFSPVYPAQESGGCFVFWYHMYGATTGGLRVYFKPESHVFGELSPKWEKFGEQGNQWLRGNISVPSVNENFQIVIEGVRGESYVGDSAIDDVQLTTSDCQAMENVNDTTTEATATNSCRGRCRTAPVTEGSCECKEYCIAASSCCSDYYTLCGNEDIDQYVYETDPGDYYGKTTSPVTVAVTSSADNTTEELTSTASLNFSSKFTSPSSITSIHSSVPVTTSTITVTSPSSSSSVFLSTDTTKILSTGATFKTGTPTVTVIRNISTSRSTLTAASITEAPSPNSITTISGKTKITTNKAVTTSSASSGKRPSSTKSTVKTSTISTFKTTNNAPKTSQATTLPPLSTPSTTTTTISQSSTITAPFSTTQISTTATPLSTTQSSTTTTSKPTTQSSTTTTSKPTIKSSTTTTSKPTIQISTTTTSKPTIQISTTTTSNPTIQFSTTPSPKSSTQSSATTTTMPKTITSTTTSSTPTTVRSTTLKPIPVTVTQSKPPSSSLATSTKLYSVSHSSAVPDTTTPRYHLRPRKTTSISISTRTSTTKTSPLTASTRASTSKTESSTISSAIRSTSQSRRWFNLTALPTSTARSTKTSTITVRLASTNAQHIPTTNKYSYRMSKSTTTESPSDSHEMIASKTESSTSNNSSSVIIGVSVFVIICIVGSVAFYIRRYRRKRLSTLDDDSQMRFLPENEYMEYSDASALDIILVK